ncbi:DNA-binding domain-containing protein [Peteryoungia desertarenae]|uniref:HvfC/BufC N-terminal domain-containing protein n=1 Tax=Peteryoungia desertarenae TaxID=1813451 RepID=UPI001FE7F665|nr:DNA-binding domain-containing protein [Peteryoungia desertarenae]
MLDPEAPVPDGLVSHHGGAVERRFAVYRNNAAVSLVDALASIFPTVQNLVGEEFFRAMAHLYVRAHPPRSPLIFTYGEDFAGFIEQFPPAEPIPFLADVARLERLWLDSFHSADTPPLDPACLSSVPPERLEDQCFQPHPAARLLSTAHAAASITIRDRAGESLSDINPMLPEAALITRPACDVAINRLSPGGHTFFHALMAGRPLGEACGEAIKVEAESDISALLTLALTSGAFADLVDNSAKGE